MYSCLRPVLTLARAVLCWFVPTDIQTSYTRIVYVKQDGNKPCKYTNFKVPETSLSNFQQKHTSTQSHVPVRYRSTKSKSSMSVGWVYLICQVLVLDSP